MSIQNYATPDDYQKFGWKDFDWRYGKISLPPGSKRKKNYEILKITIKNDKQTALHHV